MEEFKGKRLFLYNLSTAGWTLLDSIWLTFYVAFLLPPREKVAEGMIAFVSNERFFGMVTTLGALMIFGRIIDAIADPLVAFWSDRSRSKFGRRRFFLMVGGIPLAVFTVLIFFPPVASTSFINGIYLAIIFGFYFFFFTVYVTPYLALIPELGHNEKIRIGITTAQGYFSIIGSAAVMIGGPLLLTYFMRNNNMIGAYRKMVICLAVPGTLLLYSAVFSVNEKKFSGARPSNISLLDSFKKTINNKPFIIYLFANMSLWFLFNIVRSSAIPIVITLIKADEAFASTMFIVLFIIAIIFFPVIGFLTRILKKKTVMMIALGLFALFSFFLSFTGLTAFNPRLWGLVFIGLMGLPTAILIIIPNVILSELCDIDYKKSGERREAMYFGVQGFFMKLNLGFSTAILALLYSFFGKDISNPLGVRLTLIFSSIIALFGLFIMHHYPEKNIENILSE